MSFDFDTADDVAGGGGFVADPGTYHMVVTNILEGQGKKGSPINGFTVEADVLAGTVQGCDGKKWSESLFGPSGNSEAGDEWSKKKITAFLLATNLITPDKLGSRITAELQDAIGRQFLVRLEREMELDGKTGKYTIPGKYLQIVFANIYHVDDPDVKDIPKNADAIGLVPKEHRHDATWFAFKSKKSTQSAQPAVVASGDSFDDL